MIEIKLAIRALARKPGFSLSVIAMFALGIAANTAIFSIFNGLFLSSLPYPEPQRLVFLNEAAPRWNLTVVGISNLDFYTWHAQAQSFDSMAAWDDTSFNLSGFGDAIRVKAVKVTYDLAATLGIKPILGRDILPEEDRKDGRKVVLLSFGLWERKFGGAPDVLGKILQLDNQPYTIIGVLPRTAVFPDQAELWIPLAVDPTAAGSYYLGAVGRLKAGVTMDQARADLTRVHKAMIPTQKVNEVTFPTAIPLREHDLGDYRLVTQVLLGAVAFVLLIACVNVAGLMMARGSGRAREVAIRAALGAGRRALMQQLLAESLLLAAVGGVAGVGLGWLALQSMLSLMPNVLPGWVDFHLDLRFVLFALVVIGAAAVLSGLAPALESSKVDVRGFLADAAPKTSLSVTRRRSMNALVVGEIALALVLLASAGLLVKAFQNVLSVNPGFRAQNVLTFHVDLSEAKYAKAEQRTHFYDELLARLRSAPGVESAGSVSHAPLDGHTGSFYMVEGERPLGPNDQDPVVSTFSVFPGYFQAMGIAMQSGRDFDDHDGDKDRGTLAAIVSETFARRYWPAGGAIGKHVDLREDKPHWMTVVGVAHDTKNYGLDQEARPAVYMPFRQRPQSSMTIAVHGSIDPRSLISTSREIVRQLDPDLALSDIRTMQERLERSLWARRTYSWLFGVFAGLALMLAVAGIYGVVSYTVTQRTREIGIRMALGAKPEQVLGRVLGEGMLLVAIGVAIGLIGAAFVTRLLQSLLAGVSPHDPWAFVAVSLVLGGAALAANLLPARRAASVDPVHALRFE
jgi:putative ABC transport system permease protein